MSDNKRMNSDDQIQELLIRLASSLKEEDLLENPELEQQVRELVQQINPKNSIDPAVAERLSTIEDKKKRFLYAMKLLQVIPEAQSMKALAEAMQNAGLLSPGPIGPPIEKPPQEQLEGHGEERPEDDDFDPENLEPSDYVDIDENEVMRTATHKW